ncbi:MAG: hypothetical protein KKC46_07855 [Proteobacteria bacterium]|nr:hypothetical protein [Pseudomonadota bacterium]
MKHNKIILLFFLLCQLFFANIVLSEEPEVNFVDIVGSDIKDAKEAKLACDLLGLRFVTNYIGTKSNNEVLRSIKGLYNKEVLILSQRVLKYFNKDIVSMFGQPDSKSKIFIWGICSDTDIANLRIWSDNKIKHFRKFELKHLPTSISVVNNDQISKELGGLEYPFISSGTGVINGFELTDSLRAFTLINVVDEDHKPICPIFLKIDSANKSVFYLTSWEKVISGENHSLLKIIPLLMFLKYSFGDRSWHGINDYANFTIDDPWLKEPYGYLSFKDLCKEAKRAPFHATIGFIPYNYQKSYNDVIETFRQCPQNLSIAVHGNNHDFSEFRYNGNTRLADKKISSLHPDEKNILQALYRMEKFSRKTGIPFDRVMIFPRGIYTINSLSLLKKNNFLMTVNSTKPLGIGHFTNNIDKSRGITLEFENFPLVLRNEVPNLKNNKSAMILIKNWIQMRLFLDLPVILLTHHDFFKNNPNGLNSISNMINELQYKVVWTSLGNIAKNLYLQRRINDHEIEISTYSSNIYIKNKYPHIMKYKIKKQENFIIPIRSVDVDGIKHKYHRDDSYIKIEVFIKPGHEKNIQIIYHSDNQVADFTYSDDSLQATLVRNLSDFRDLYLPKLPFGDKMVIIFYWIGGVKGFGIVLLGFTVVFIIILILHKRKKAKS